jgi:thiol-disulfide isomerase/thioredoxin
MKLPSLWAMLTMIALCVAGSAANAETDGQQLAVGAGQSLIGTAAPRLVLKTIDGETIDLGKLYGKQAVYLKLWATWCVPCRQQMPHFEHVYETAGPDLAVIAINIGFNDTIDAIRLYRKKLGITMPIVLDDGRVGAALHLRVTPQHIVIGRDGRIEYVGHLADASLDAALVAARKAPGVQAPRPLERASSTVSDRKFKIGDTLPQHVVLTLEDRSFQFQPPEGARATVFVFLAPWCESYLATTRPVVAGQCRAARTLVTALAHDEHVRWLGVASGLWASKEDLEDYRSHYKINIPLTLDDTSMLFHEFGVNNTPTLIVADSKGTVVRRIEPGELGSLRQALQGL